MFCLLHDRRQTTSGRFPINSQMIVQMGYTHYPLTASTMLTGLEVGMILDSLNPEFFRSS